MSSRPAADLYDYLSTNDSSERCPLGQSHTGIRRRRSLRTPSPAPSDRSCGPGTSLSAAPTAPV